MWKNKLWLQVGRFGVVGVTATLVHILVFTLLRLDPPIDAQLANFFAFVCAFTLSWSGHYFWTFQSGGKQSAIWFLAVALIGYGVNSFWVWLFITTYLLPDFMAMGAIVAFTPLLTFVLSKFFAFRAR